MPKLRPATSRRQPGRYKEFACSDSDSSVEDQEPPRSSFAPELSWTTAFPTRALDDPRRHPNEALADFHRAADRILRQPISVSSSGPDSAAATGLIYQQKEDFLTQAIDSAKEQLEAQFARWRRSFSTPAGSSKAKRRGHEQVGESPQTVKRQKIKSDRSKTAGLSIGSSSSSDNSSFNVMTGKSGWGLQGDQAGSTVKSMKNNRGGTSSTSCTTWQAVPDNMKLIVVRELTSWFAYDETVTLLKLTSVEEAGFRALYDREQRKLAAYTIALRQYEASQVHERELLRYITMSQTARDIFPSGLASPVEMPFNSRYYLPPIADPGLITDIVTVRQITMAQEYLSSVGFVRDTVDLGHWLGHSGGGRFEIDMFSNCNGCEEGGHGHGHNQPVIALKGHSRLSPRGLAPAAAGTGTGDTVKRRRKKAAPEDSMRDAATDSVEVRMPAVPAATSTRGRGSGRGGRGRGGGGGRGRGRQPSFKVHVQGTGSSSQPALIDEADPSVAVKG